VKLDLDVVVDETGRLWRTGSPDLLRHLNITRRDYDLANYLVRNLGFVRLRTRRSDARVLLQPRFLTKAAYESLIFLLVTQDPHRTVLQTIDTPERLEIIPDLEDAASRLADLAAQGGSILREDFFREPLSFDRMRRNARLAPIAALLRQWQALGGVLPANFDLVMGNPALLGRAMVLQMGGSSRGIVEYVGDGFASFDATWRNRLLGHDPCNQPDPGYAMNAAYAYDETHRAQEPRLELVEAVIRVPGRRACRYRYERMLLPWRRGSSAFVSVVSSVRSAFTLAA
jgi:hypothetical protein